MTFVEDIYALTSSFPREELFGLTSQLRRAAVSVPSLVAEGHRQGTRAYRDTKSAVAEDLPEETVALLQQTAVAVFQALELRDYARIDMRLRPDGRVAVIEANPNPWLASKAEFAMAARKSGRNYTQLIEELVDLAMARYS